MDLYCTRPGCPRPLNSFADLDDTTTLKTVQQKYCTTCGMQLILVGRYLPQKLLGRGGFGAAFLARDRHTPRGMRQCVVKQFQPSGNLTAAQLEVAQALFEREAEVLEDLGNTHPQIPDLFAFFELTVPSLQPGRQDQFFYLVQEYIDGQTLEDELAQKGQLSATEVTQMLEEILEILKFVHENGSIHRDIKPSNIMRHRNGRFYLLDFGAVKQATKGTANRSTGIYSLGFAPPEQVAGAEVYPSTDLYALAVTCLMLLTGKEPTDLFDSYSNRWNWRIHATQVSPALADALDRMLLPAPNQRFQSAGEALDALKHPDPRLIQRAAAAASVVPAAPSGLPQPLATPAAQPASSPSAPPRPRSTIATFSTLELLGGAAFTGFEASLLAIALFSLPIPSIGSAGLWLLLCGGLVYAQSRRIIERIDLLIIAAITLALVVFLPILRSIIPLPVGVNPIVTIGLLAAMAAACAIAITALFRLIYKLLSTLL